MYGGKRGLSLRGRGGVEEVVASSRITPTTGWGRVRGEILSLKKNSQWVETGLFALNLKIEGGVSPPCLDATTRSRWESTRVRGAFQPLAIGSGRQPGRPQPGLIQVL
jgi:hypothetical protein